MTFYLLFSIFFVGPLDLNAHEVPIKSFLTKQIDNPTSSHIKKVSTNANMIESEKLLWSLVATLTDISIESNTKQLLNIENVVLNRIVSLLTANPNNASTSYTILNAAAAKTTAIQSPTSIDDQRIEDLLLKGQREDAARLAVENGDWGLALLISSVCGVELYQAISKQYATSRFTNGSPLHVLSMQFSNQALDYVQRGGRSLFQHDGSKGSSQSLESSISPTRFWKRNLAAILSNKGSDWQEVVRAFGTRIESELHDMYASHFTFLCSGLLSTRPGSVRTNGNSSGINAAQYTLLGCDVGGANAFISNSVSISSFLLTEIVECLLLHCMKKRKESSNSSSAGSLLGAVASGSVSIVGKSLGGLLGFSRSSESISTIATTTASTANALSQDNVRANESRIHGNELSSTKNDLISALELQEDNILRMQVTLTFAKFRYAATLADYGYVKAAMQYCDNIKLTIGQFSNQGKSNMI